MDLNSFIDVTKTCRYLFHVTDCSCERTSFLDAAGRSGQLFTQIHETIKKQEGLNPFWSFNLFIAEKSFKYRFKNTLYRLSTKYLVLLFIPAVLVFFLFSFLNQVCLEIYTIPAVGEFCSAELKQGHKSRLLSA